MIKIHRVEQRTPEWTELRLGKMTGSKIKSIIDVRTGKLKSKAVLLTAASKMIAETCTGFSNDADYMSDAMEWGIEQEAVVAEKYDKFSTVGFVTNDSYKYLGLSPDLIVDSEKVKFAVEIKCPNSDTHIKYIIEDKIPSDYMPQVLNYFLVLEDLQMLEFVSYDPRNVKNEYFKKRVTREELKPILEEAKSSVLEFENIVDGYLNKVKV